MQDIQMIGAAGRIFTGGGVGGNVDRRLRQNHLQNQALKCPRCDSLNTKFCYYNNYNLSQPRHFCKACRRYWTKGGVLRNVPVGGGCRKSSKRSSKPKTHHHSSESSTKPRPNSNNSNSSSESSSLTGTTNTTVAVNTTSATADLMTACATTPPTESSSTLNAMFGFAEQKYIFPQIRNPHFGTELMSGADGSSFNEIGNFSNLMTSSNNDRTVVNMSGSYDDISPFQQQQQQYDDDHQMEQWQQEEAAKMQQQQQEIEMEMSNAPGDQFGDRTVEIDRSGNNGGSEPLDWQQQLQQHQHHMFAVDEGYWGQQHWSEEADQNPAQHHLYLP